MTIIAAETGGTLEDRSMRNVTLCLSLALLSATCAAAPPTEASIRTLFEVMKAQALLDGIYATLEPAMRQSMSQAAAGKTLDDEQKRVLELAPQRLSAVLRLELSWEQLLPLQIAIYQASFEQSEVDGLIAFYRSPVGQSFVNKMPVVSQKAMAATQAHMQQVMPKLKAAMDQVLAEARLAPPR